MTLIQTSRRLILVAALIISAGCATGNPRSQMANSGNDALPVHNPAQLLAAARQYEKEGRSDLASRYYRQVLKQEPDNVEANNGLELVQSGQLRTESSYREIVSAAQPQSRPRLRSRVELAAAQAEVDEKTAQIIANAAATATAQAIANAVAKATSQYMDDPSTAAKQAKAEPTPDFELKVASSAGKANQSPDEDESPVAATADTTLPSHSADDLDVVNLEVVTNEKVTTNDVLSPKTAMGNADESNQVVAADVSEELPRTFSKDFSKSGDVPQETHWQPTALTRLCYDANAAVLREVAKLESDDPAVRNEGLYALAQMGPDASSATLAVRMLLHDKVELVRAHAAWTAWELTGEVVTASEPLTKLLESGESDVVQFASYTLADLGENAQSALPSLRLLLESDDRRVRLHAAETIAKIGPPRDRAAAIDTLVMLTAERSAEIRTLAILALGSVVSEPTSEIKTALTSALHDGDAEVRTAAALTLGGFGEAARSSVGDLRFVLESDRQDVRQAAATALDCIHPQD